MDLSKIKLIALDFDGVLTDNKVLLNEYGEEFVSCSRGDGIAFDALRKMKIHTIILSTEKNKVVSSRAKKLQVQAIQNIPNKMDKLLDLIDKYQLDRENIIFVGNDINDIDAMSLCKLSFCPSDSHKLVKKAAKIILKTKGGNGVMREILEVHFKVDTYKLLYG
jgi:N-acylneuraminate cytidylyltransferase